MEVQTILDYIGETPENTNTNILKEMLEELQESGGQSEMSLIYLDVETDGETGDSRLVRRDTGEYITEDPLTEESWIWDKYIIVGPDNELYRHTQITSDMETGAPIQVFSSLSFTWGDGINI